MHDKPENTLHNPSINAHYRITYIGQFLVLGAGFLAFRFANTVLGADGFGEYAVMRRAISLVYLPALMAMGASVPRYVAMDETGEDKTLAAETRRDLMAGAGLLIAMVYSLLAIPCFTAPGHMAALVFGSQEHGDKIPFIWLMAFALSWHGVGTAYLRGRFQMLAANTVQVVNLGLLPLLVFLLPVTTAAGYYRTLSLAVLAVAGIVWSILLVMNRATNSTTGLKRSLKRLLRYGLPRTPGELATAGFLGIPVFFATHDANLAYAGYLSFGLTTISLVRVFLGPIGLVLLPDVSRVASLGFYDEIGTKARRLALLAVGTGTLAAVSLWFLAPWMAGRFLGSTDPAAARTLQIVGLAALPFAVYVGLRSFADALVVKPYNTYITIFAIVVFLVTKELGIVEAFLLSSLTLGLGSSLVTWYLLGRYKSGNFEDAVK